jgi:PAS domain S-box-containing protein
MEEKRQKFRFRLTIGNKILGGFLILIALFIVNVFIIVSRGNLVDNTVNTSSEVYRPSQAKIKDFILMVTRSKMLVTNWVYLQTNEEDKKALKQLQDHDYPQLYDDIKKLMPLWESDSQRQWMDTVFMKFDTLIKVQRETVMATLQTFENYEDPLNKLLAEDAIDSQIIPRTTDIIERLDRVAAKQDEITAHSDMDIRDSVRNLLYYTFILGASIILIGLASAFALMRTITRPVNFLKNVIVKLGRGELVEEKGRNFSSDEIGEMALATENLVAGLKATSQFAENIGNGNYNTEFKPLSGHDVLGNALINMRDNLAKVADDDKKRNWATEGQARFGEILRTNSNDVDRLTDDIIGNLVKYLKANQGALYIVDDQFDAHDDPTMSMKACYAWDKKKFLNQKIYRGEGLAGQAWQEGDTVYITDVPQNYVRITSGLGDSNPTSVLIVPLKFNDQIFGVVELASFNVFEQFEIEFVQKIAESIASTISTVKINARTHKLLEESQEMTEQMRAQEEEMRQNMEELQATQEEMQRTQAETESTLNAIHGSLAVVEYNPDGTIVKANSNFLDLFGYTQDEVLGEHHRIFVSKDDKSGEEYRQFWKDRAAGFPKKGTYPRINRKGESIMLRSAYSPIRNRMGEVTKVLEIAYEVKGVEVQQ